LGVSGSIHCHIVKIVIDKKSVKISVKFCFKYSLALSFECFSIYNKKAVLPQGNRAMPQVFFSVEVRQQHSLQV